MHYVPWMAAAAPFLAAVSLIGAVAALVVGLSLMARKPWARTAAIILGILVLIRVPFGTAMGIYTLWVLAPVESAVEYDSIADRT
jgi:hypothetical protein